MPVKISHIVIPVKSVEEMKKAGEFFVNVIGLHIRDGLPPDGLVTGTDIWTEQGIRKPDRILHLLDDYDTFVDVVLYETQPVCFAKGVGSGKGVALAFRVPDIKEAWGIPFSLYMIRCPIVMSQNLLLWRGKNPGWESLLLFVPSIWGGYLKMESSR
jgi:catechol 2,3-dioxygenase-like lactoylglutathione lyase family enzyme